MITSELVSAAHTIVALTSEVTAELSADRAFFRTDARRVLRLRVTSRAIGEALAALAEGKSSLQSLVEKIALRGGPAEVTRFALLLRRIATAGFLSYEVRAGERTLCTLACVAPSGDVIHEPEPGAGALRLSRFAFNRLEADTLVLETPLSPVCVRIHDEAIMRLLWEVRTPREVTELTSRFPEVDRRALETVLALFVGARLLDRIDPAVAPQEDAAQLPWEFHDLLFHSRSRKGRTKARFGGTYRFGDRLPPSPKVRDRDASDGAEVSLARPDLDALSSSEAPFTRVLESRRSIREYGAPLTLEQLGHFLYRTCRMKGAEGGGLDNTGHRVAPGGGGCHELDVYVIPRQCDGLPPGLFRYDPRNHVLLARTVSPGSDVAELLEDATNAMRVPPQVLVILCARFQRITRKYESLAYALILKDAGVLIQTMYLVATAMGLAPCALGTGDSDLFARTAGTRYLVESSVAEFALGTASPGARR